MLQMLWSSMTMAATIRLATPLILTALGGTFADRANIFNIGLESFMLVSSFFAMLGSYLFQNPYMGLLFGIASSVVMSIIFGILVLHFGSNAMVVGIALNLGAWGLTTLLLDSIFHVRGAFIDPRIASFPQIHIPVLERIPYVGAILSGQNLLVYLAYVSVILCWIVMYKTPFGLRVRGVGLNEQAAQTAGVSISKYRWIATIITGVFSGIAGTFLSLGGISMFTENMSAGKGFLALAAIMIGKGNPAHVFLACLVFAYSDAVSVGLQSYNIPSQVVLMLPYIVTVIILTIVGVTDRRKIAKGFSITV